MLAEPFDGGLRAHLRHAGHVVDAVADQGQIVEHLVGADAELGDDARFVERLVRHRVLERDVRGDELHEVLVAGGNHALHAVALGGAGERADDVIGLDAALHQERPAVRADDVVQRRDLRPHRIGHRRAVGLVLGIPVVAKGLARRVEDHGEVVRRLGGDELPQHREHAAHRAGWFPRTRAQVGHRVECTVQV